MKTYSVNRGQEHGLPIQFGKLCPDGDGNHLIGRGVILFGEVVEGVNHLTLVVDFKMAVRAG